MHILLSNDDGIYAPGLTALATVLSENAKVTVIAPDRDRSGASNSLTLDRPLRINTLENGFISVEGTPTDCVHLAMTGLLKDRPDIVVSGVNSGANLGDDVFYSGTVAAAMEGGLMGLPAIALSLNLNALSPLKFFLTAAKVAKWLVPKLLEGRLPTKTILNVNVPNLEFPEIKGISVTRLGSRHIAEPTIPSVDPRGNSIYWIGAAGVEQDAGPGTDFYAVRRDEVSITPLHLDMTYYTGFEKIAGWVNHIAASFMNP